MITQFPKNFKSKEGKSGKATTASEFFTYADKDVEAVIAVVQRSHYYLALQEPRFESCP